MLGWRFVCLLAAGFAVATTLVQADQRSDSASLLVLAADAQVETKVAPKTDVTSEAKTNTKAEAAVKAGAKTGVKADAKADSKAGAKPKISSQTVNERVAMWLKTCLQDWDTATHMSKDQWRTTCERVSKERGKFLSETPESLSLPGKR